MKAITVVGASPTLSRRVAELLEGEYRVVPTTADDPDGVSAAAVASGSAVVMVNANANDAPAFARQVELVRSLTKTYHCRILVSFSGERDQAVDQVLNAGAVDYVVVPFRRVDLVSRVRRVQQRVEKTENTAHASAPSQPRRSVSAPPHVRLPELHNPDSGRLDAARIAAFLGIPLKRLSEGLRMTYQAVHRTPDSESVQPALRPIKRILDVLVDALHDTAVIRAWLSTPRPELEGASPLQVIAAGESPAVLTLLENALAGVPD